MKCFRPQHKKNIVAIEDSDDDSDSESEDDMPLSDLQKSQPSRLPLKKRPVPHAVAHNTRSRKSSDPEPSPSKVDNSLRPSPPAAKAKAQRLAQRTSPRKVASPPRSSRPKRKAAPQFGVPDDVLEALANRPAKVQKRSSSQPAKTAKTGGLQVKTVVLRRRTQGRRFKCPVSSCMLYYDSRKAVDKHAREDHEQVVECNVCQKRFGNKSALTRHQVAHTAGRARYQCGDCDKEFQYQSQLAKHELSHRSDVKKYKCHVRMCGAEFKYKGDLNRHLPFHQQVDRIECRFKGCSYSSLSKKKVSEHEYNHLRTPDQCKCACGFTCKWRAQMKKHLEKKQRGCARM